MGSYLPSTGESCKGGEHRGLEQAPGNRGPWTECMEGKRPPVPISRSGEECDPQGCGR